MEINFNSFYIHRINYMISEISASTAGSRYWVNSPLPNRIHDYITIRSTFPDYCKFFFFKKPKNWYILTGEEKEKEEYFFAGNKKELLHILNKSKTNKKLTYRQQLLIQTISENCCLYELDWYHQYNEQLINY